MGKFNLLIKTAEGKMKNNKKSCDIASITAKILKKYTVQGLFLFNIAFLLYYKSLFTSREEKK